MASFTYDANGNLITDGTWTYTYDVENRLVHATGAGKDVTLTYDPLGRLYFVGGSNVGDVHFVYDGDALIEEYSSTGTMTSRYVHGSNTAADDPLVWYAGSAVGSGNRQWLHADHLGSIVARTNGGAPSINSYDEYGITGANNGGRFGYTGQAWLYEIGLDYYKARMYSPTLGRFLQTDPIGYEGGINIYEYAGDDPIDHADPSGLYDCNSHSQCSQIEGARKEIMQARDNLRQQTGSRIPSSGYTMLNSTLTTLGTKNDGNGLTVNFGALPPGRLGQDIGNTITLDPKQIRSQTNESVAGILTHELSHQYDADHHLDAGFRVNEVKANAVQSLYEIGSGRPGEFYKPGISGVDLIRRIKESGMARPYCPSNFGATGAACAADINRVRPDVPIQP